MTSGPGRASDTTAAEQIIDDTCTVFFCTRAELLSTSRETQLVRARQHTMYQIRHHTQLSLPAIGRILNRDHTTVLHGIRAETARRTP